MLASDCVLLKRRPVPPPKDTLANLVASGEGVVNIITEDFVEAANHTCGEWRDRSEWEEVLHYF